MLAVCAGAIPLAAFAIRGLRSEPEGRSVTQPALSRKRRWMAVGLLMAVGLAGRSTRLNESLWYDEIASWMTYTAGTLPHTAGAIVASFFDPINHVAHTLLNWISVNALASAVNVELAFRLPALVFSLLSIITVFGMVRAAGGSDRVTILAGGLMAIVPVSVLEGVEARGYSMMVCLAALMTWLLMEARSRKRLLYWSLYAVTCALGIWSQFVTAFVPIGHGVWLAWRAFRFGEWRQTLQGLVALMLGAVLTLTLYAPMIPGMLAARGIFAAERSDQPRILGTEGWHALLQFGGSWYWWAATPGLIIAATGAVALFRLPLGECKAMRSAVMLSLFGLPIMLLTVALAGSWVYARFMLFALPGALLLMAIGLDALWRWHQPVALVALAAVLISSMADLSLRPPKQPLRDAADFVRTNHYEGDRTLVVGLAHEVMRLYAGDLNLTYSFRHGQDLALKLVAVNPQWVVIEYPNRVSQANYTLLTAAGFREAARFRGWADWGAGDVLVLARR
jgi:hypothetical protein